MKIITIIPICLALLAIGWAEPVEENDTFLEESSQGEENLDYIDNILKAFLERLRKGIKDREPYPLPVNTVQKIKDKHVQVVIKINKVKENHASSFVVNKLNNHIFQMSEDYDVTFPKIDFTGNYVIKGKILGKKVQGKGKFHVSTKDLRVWGTAYTHLVNLYVQFKKLTLDYTVKKLTATVTGLKVHGLSKQKVNSLLSNALHKYLTHNEKRISNTISKSVVAGTNKIIYGKTLTQFLHWLKHFVPHRPKHWSQNDM